MLATTRAGRREVAACCARAWRDGVRPGMTLAQAGALVAGELTVDEHEPRADAAALTALARWSRRWTPRAATDGTDGLMLDMTGCDRLWGKPGRMARRVLDTMDRLGVEARAGIAPSRGGAWALARSSDRPAVIADTPQSLADRLDTLPPTLLRLEPAEVDGLAEVGVERVGELRALPREGLADRFGAGVLRRLDQALGLIDEPIEPVRGWEPPSVERRFEGPVLNVEAIALASRELVDGLCSELVRRRRAAGRVRLSVERLDERLRMQIAHRDIELSRPTRQAKHLWALLSPIVERMHLGCGVEAMTLTAARAPRREDRQLSTGLDARGVTPPSELPGAGVVDVLSAQLGREAVRRVELIDTHVPEAAAATRPACEAREDREVNADRHAALAAVRPTVLLDPPEPAEVVLMNPEGPLMSLRWRDRHARVITSVGPERIAPRWWRARASTSIHDAARDYYRLQDDAGRWLWVYRSLTTGRWHVHGLWP